jgi:hypothetical protein
MASNKKKKRPDAMWFIPSREDAARRRKEARLRKREQQLKKTDPRELPGPLPANKFKLPPPSVIWSGWASHLPPDLSDKERTSMEEHAVLQHQLAARVEERGYRKRRARERLLVQYEVQAIVDERINVSDNTREFKVVWEGWPLSDASWVAMEDLNCPEVLEAWFKERDSFF